MNSICIHRYHTHCHAQSHDALTLTDPEAGLHCLPRSQHSSRVAPVPCFAHRIYSYLTKENSNTGTRPQDLPSGKVFTPRRPRRHARPTQCPIAWPASGCGGFGDRRSRHRDWLLERSPIRKPVAQPGPVPLGFRRPNKAPVASGGEAARRSQRPLVKD